MLVGEALRVDLSALQALPNVTLIGEVPYARLPEYIHGFDVCVLPYRICNYALASDPMKVWEYLAAGKPVVAMRFPEIERLKDMITLTDNPEEFVQGIRTAFCTDNHQKAEERKAFAGSNTWSRRCDAMEKAVASFFPKGRGRDGHC